MAKGQLAEKPKNELASTASLDFLHGNASAGFEHVGAADVLMPRFTILQDLSPQINQRKAEYVEGAKAGMILNVATGQLYGKLPVLPAFYERRFIEWLPNRGGFVADHGTDESIMGQTTQNDAKFDVLPNGNLVVPTATWYVLDLAAGGERAIIAMSRTQLKPSRQWMSLATSEKVEHPQHGQFTPPLFFRSYELSTLLRDNGDNEWFVWSAKRGPSILELNDPSLMQKAVAFRDLLLKGEIRASAESFADDADVGAGGGPSTPADTI